LASDDDDYDSAFDSEPFLDTGGMTLLVPVFRKVERKGKSVPRVSLVCESCLDMAVNNTADYMKKIRAFSSRIPDMKKSEVVEVREPKQRLMPKAFVEHTGDLGKQKVFELINHFKPLSHLLKVDTIVKKTKDKKGRTKTTRHEKTVFVNAPAITHMILDEFAVGKGFENARALYDSVFAQPAPQEEEE